MVSLYCILEHMQNESSVESSVTEQATRQRKILVFHSDSIQVGFNFSGSFQKGLESKLCPWKYYKVHLEEKTHGRWNREAP